MLCNIGKKKRKIILGYKRSTFKFLINHLLAHVEGKLKMIVFPSSSYRLLEK